MRLPGILAAVVMALTASGCSLLTTSIDQVAPACAARVDRGVIPDWSRAGFSQTEPSVPHSLGREGEIVAILFGDPLTAPPSADHNNKILWVAHVIPAASDLEISAQRMDGPLPVGDPVARIVQGGPGPSIIDLPDAGCWRLTLHWANLTDSVDLEYVRPAGLPG